jgi:triacylglycerol lipase
MYKTKYPIILAHGICRFDQVLNILCHIDNREDDRFHYFRKIRKVFINHGFEAFHSSVRWAGSVEERSEDLKNSIEALTDNFKKWDKVHIIAHSMGGLDARHMIYNYKMDHRVASLSTISTPHGGSSFADWGVRHFPFLIPLARKTGINITGFKDLTRQNCRKFNEKAWDFERKNSTFYQTFGGTLPYDRILPLFKFSYSIIYREEGENDGLVPLKSAQWKNEFFIKRIDADHLNQIGWWHPWGSVQDCTRKQFEKRIQKFYLEIVEGLADRGM